MEKLKTILLLGIMMLGGIAVTSCSGDDDDDGGRASTSMGVLDSTTGLRVKSACNYDYRYNENGQLLYILNGSYSRFEFSYNPNKIVYIGEANYDDPETYSVSYNGNGYLSSFSGSNSWEGDDGGWNETSNATLSYDNSGHLTKVTITYDATEYDIDEYGGRSSEFERGTCTITFTWSNNLLQQVVESDEGRDDDGPYTYTEEYIFAYNNDAMANNANKYLQYSCFDNDMFNGILERMSYVGLLGKGPAYLPSGASTAWHEEYYEENGEKKTYNNSHDYSYRYGFNNDGSLSYAYWDNRRYSFSYDYADVKGSSNPFTRATDAAPKTEVRKQKRHTKLARHGIAWSD